MAKAATAPLSRMVGKFTVGDGCWEWTGAKTGFGYGKILTFRSIRVAHRVLYELLVGQVPDGMELDHLCRNPACVRPDHLEPVTHRENIVRAVTRTHCPQGHAYTKANTYLYARGASTTRMCKRCQYDRNRRRRLAKQKE